MSELLSIGISHHTASVDIREKMWLNIDETKEAVSHLLKKRFQECVVISTCNRTELYGTASALPDPSDVQRFLIDFKKATGSVRDEHFTNAIGTNAVSHLFRVAAGIESQVIGDIQILNQVKESFQISRELDALGPLLNHLMQSALHVGKRVRTETQICEGAVSISYAAVELANKIFADLSKKAVLLIGAGETGELTLKHLIGRGIGSVKVANRTREKADELVTRMSGSVVDYKDLQEALRSVDIVISSVTSPSYIVQPQHVQSVMKQRSHNPLFIIDIGVPRNVDPRCKKIDNVFLYDIDSLHTIVERNVDHRRDELPKVKDIIEEEVNAFIKWQNSLSVGPTIHDLRNVFESIRAEEVEKNINRFSPDDRQLIDIVTKRIINKILHQPTTALKDGAEDQGRNKETLQRINALRELFGIAGHKLNGNEKR